MRTRLTSILETLVKQTKPFAVRQSVDIPEWRTYTGRHFPAGVFTVVEDSEGVIRTGERWETGYDRTQWFCADIEIPEELRSSKLYLELDFGGEAIVRINGKIAGAVSSRAENGWVFRDKIFINGNENNGRLSIELEATVDCGGFCDAAMAGAKSMFYTISKARVIEIDEATESYVFDLENVLASLPLIADEAIRARVYEALDDSLHTLDFDFSPQRFYDSVPAAEKLLWDKLGAVDYRAPGEVLALGHSHLDVAWLWTIREIVRKTARTFSNNLALIDHYPDFKFTQSQAVVYDFIKEHYPELFERVREAVKSGRWEIVGNAWVEADTNLANGESLIRQLLYGREFFLREFGVCSDTYWLPDCFGFSWALPQIIERSGMKYFLTSKLNNNDTSPFPYNYFRWRSHSGNEVLACLTPTGYQGELDPNQVSRARNGNRQKALADVATALYGYGDGGGGCTFAMVENSRRIGKIPGMPAVRTAFSSDFFAELEKCRGELPVWDGELYYEKHRGTYTSQAFVKKNNRSGEFLLRNAEAASVLARAFLGKSYPADELFGAWKLLLVNQFHDILPGSSIHEVYDDARLDYAKLRKVGGEVLSDALGALEGETEAPSDGVLVASSLTSSSSVRVETEIPFESAHVTDADGKLLPCLVTKQDGKNLLSFIAESAVPFGFTFYAVEPAQAQETECVTAKKDLLENSRLRVALDENGLLTSVFDKAEAREILTSPGNLMTVFSDKPAHESAWNLEADYKKKAWRLEQADSIEVIEASPVRGVIRVVRSFNESVITQDIILAADSPRIDFDTRVSWHETEKILKAEFPVAIRSTSASLEIAHGAKECPTHSNTPFDDAKFEVCAHKWFDLSEGGYGVSVLNDCKYGCDISENVMRISLMRAPNLPDPTADKGESTFVYSLLPHKNGWRDGGTVQSALELNTPPSARFVKKHAGSLKAGKSFVEISRGNVILDALKAAQDGDGIILRVYEAETRRSPVTIKLAIPFEKVTQCNLMEVNECELPCSDGSFTFDIKPHEVKTFRIR